MVEVTLSIVIVSGMLLSSVSLLGAVRTGERSTLDRGAAMLLAQRLMAEIQHQKYSNPDAVSTTIGKDAGELAGLTRAPYDDVDDYNGWTETTPTEKDGTALTQYAGWTRRVEVDWWDPATQTKSVGTEKHVKLIVVIVERGGRVLARLSALRTAHDDESKTSNNVIGIAESLKPDA